MSAGRMVATVNWFPARRLRNGSHQVFLQEFSPACRAARAGKTQRNSISAANRRSLACRAADQNCLFPLLVEHDLFRKPVSTPDQVRGGPFRDHALGPLPCLGTLGTPIRATQRLAEEQTILIYAHDQDHRPALVRKSPHIVLDFRPQRAHGRIDWVRSESGRSQPKPTGYLPHARPQRSGRGGIHEHSQSNNQEQELRA